MDIKAKEIKLTEKEYDKLEQSLEPKNRIYIGGEKNGGLIIETAKGNHLIFHRSSIVLE